MSLIISSCRTLRLKRRSALSRVSPSRILTSANETLFLFPDLGSRLQGNRFRPDAPKPGAPLISQAGLFEQLGVARISAQRVQRGLHF